MKITRPSTRISIFRNFVENNPLQMIGVWKKKCCVNFENVAFERQESRVYLDFVLSWPNQDRYWCIFQAQRKRQFSGKQTITKICQSSKILCRLLRPFFVTMPSSRPSIILPKAQLSKWKATGFCRLKTCPEFRVRNTDVPTWCVPLYICFFCLELHADCNNDVMKLRISFNDSFTGMIYSAGKILP